MDDAEAYPKLIWLDLEMTGLDPDSERIIEIATLVTNNDLTEVIEGPDLVIKQSDEYLNHMDEWNTNQHTQSGLLDQVRSTSMSTKEAEMLTLNFLRKHSEKNKSPLCGNSISHDRRFLNRYMPELASFLHYRNIDVSSIKELVNRWHPHLQRPLKKGSHRAMEDIKGSIEELKYYKENLFIKTSVF